jgi:hypothetical protein
LIVDENSSFCFLPDIFESSPRRLALSSCEIPGRIQFGTSSSCRTDYPAEFPLREVLVIARHCARGIILGFEQFQATAGTWKRGTRSEKKLGAKQSVSVPTPWNHLEAGILFGLKLPLLIFREEGISGGVFDDGVTDVFIHKMPPSHPAKSEEESLKEVFLKWHARVSAHYFGV